MLNITLSANKINKNQVIYRMQDKKTPIKIAYPTCTKEILKSNK